MNTIITTEEFYELCFEWQPEKVTEPIESNPVKRVHKPTSDAEEIINNRCNQNKRIKTSHKFVLCGTPY